MADYIPLKIQTEIMKRLPVISLIQFRSVSKQWKSVIDSPEFIAQHCVIQSQHHLLIRYLETGVSSIGMIPRYISIVDDDDTFPHQKVFMTTPVYVNQLKFPASLVGVSGGLFCTYCSSGYMKYSAHAVIWNPSIKKTVAIVVPNVPDADDDDDDNNVNHLSYHTTVGFGVCPRTSDPKLVKITYNTMYQEEYATIPNQVEVFSLRSGLWKRPSSSKLPRNSVRYIYPQVAINEFIYWLAHDMSSKDQQYYHLIMSFDLTSEEFTQVYLPQSLASRKTQVSISNLKESLVVLEQNDAFNANVWIMQNGSFTHIFTINTIGRIRYVAGFRNNGEPIIAQNKGFKESQLIVYKPKSKQINSTGIVGPFCCFIVSPYTQTLLLLDHKDSVDSETPFRIDKQGSRSGLFRRGARTLKGVTSSSAATFSSTSCYYGAQKRYSQEEVNELVKKKSKSIGKRISACFNKKLVNLMTQLAEKGISLDMTPVIGEEDEDYKESVDEAMEDVYGGMKYEADEYDD